MYHYQSKNTIQKKKKKNSVVLQNDKALENYIVFNLEVTFGSFKSFALSFKSGFLVVSSYFFSGPLCGFHDSGFFRLS